MKMWVQNGNAETLRNSFLNVEGLSKRSALEKLLQRSLAPRGNKQIFHWDFEFVLYFRGSQAPYINTKKRTYSKPAYTLDRNCQDTELYCQNLTV
jgi:hypothetical protein